MVRFMRQIRQRIVCGTLLAAALFSAAALWSQPGRLTNPILPNADPFITRAHGNYILLATTGRNITLWLSPRMEELAGSRKVVWTPSATDPLEKLLTQIWSPTLWEFNGQWWIYFTATTDHANSGHGIFALRSAGDDPLGPYTFAGKVETGQPSIDPSLLRVGDRSYLMFVSVTGGHNAVWIAPLSGPMTLERPANLFIYPDMPWEQGAGSTNSLPVAEGPTALYHGGRIFVVYSGSHTATPVYCLGLFTYAGKGEITDPHNWRKSGPVFEQSAKDGVYGPGRGTFTTSPDGRENWILYAAKTSSAFTAAVRSVRAQPFTYDANGMPKFGSPVSLGTVLAAPSGEPATAQRVSARPCDLYASATPCVAAFSTTRALYSAYTGPLYQVTRASDKTRIDIGLLPDGYAKAAAQDSFCANTSCTIARLYDQSPNHNHLTPAPGGGAARGPGPDGYDVPAVADALPVTAGGHKVYGIAISAGMGYRNDTPANTAVRGQPEGVYMVTSALHLNDKCCFDFGNAETNNLDNKAGHMDAINIMCHGNPCSPDAGLDMEDGIYGHLKVPAGTAFVTDMGSSDGQHSYAIYQGNAQSGALTTTGAIPLPNGYRPMQQEGAIILGIGGDNSNWATGYFFEGVMTRGMPSQQTMEAVQGNVVAAGYAGQLKP